jgi:glycosyltransferase involved in cell wall biosynthesis
MRPKRILLISPAFPPLISPESIVNGKLAQMFIANGCLVKAVCRDRSRFSDYAYRLEEQSSQWGNLSDNTHEIPDVKVGVFQRYLDTAQSILSTRYFIDGCRWANQASKVISSLDTEFAFDVVISRSPPDIAHLPALMLHRTNNIPWIANWNDPSDDVPRLLIGKGTPHNLSREVRRFFSDVVSSASWHTFPSERLRRYAQSYLPGSYQKSSVVPHVALPYEYSPPTKHNKFVVCHSGRLVVSAEKLFAGIQRLRDRNESFKRDFVLQMIGIVSEDNLSAAKRLKIQDCIEWKGSRGYFETLEALKECDVLLLQELEYDEGIVLLSKFVDYAQIGRPIFAISPINGTISDYLNAYGGGIAVDCTSIDAIVEKLLLLYEQWKAGTLEHAYSSKRLLPLFSGDFVSQAYDKIFTMIMKSPGGTSL